MENSLIKNNIDKDLDETKALLIKNTEKLLQRNDHLNDIEISTNNLVSNSTEFRRRTKKFSYSMFLKKNYCCFIGIFIIFFFFLMFLLIYIADRNNDNNDKNDLIKLKN